MAGTAATWNLEFPLSFSSRTVEFARFALALLLVFMLSETAAQAASFTPLRDSHGASSSVWARDVSGDGTVVVGGAAISTGSRSLEPFVWTATDGLRSLGLLSGEALYGLANAISDDGTNVVGVKSIEGGGGVEAFAWSFATGVHRLGDFAGGAFHSSAQGVSSDGALIVGIGHHDGNFEAFSFDESRGMIGLGQGTVVYGSGYSEATDVSADGSIIAGFGVHGDEFEAFVWTTQGLSMLGDLPGGVTRSQAKALSADGTTVVGIGSSAIGSEAFRWNAANGMRGLGVITENGGRYSEAHDTSADGSIVVGRSYWMQSRQDEDEEEPRRIDPAETAFVWDEVNGMRRIDVLLSLAGVDLDGWTLESAVAVSADGRTIVGSGVDARGQLGSWIAVIPEPSTALLLLLGLAGLSGRRRID